MDKSVSKLDAGSKRTWKLQQTVSELQTWSVYLQQSAERFNAEFTKYSSHLTSMPQHTQKAFKEVTEGLLLMQKESALLKSRSRRLFRKT